MATVENIAIEVALGILFGAVYGLVWFARARQKGNGEELDLKKLGATLLVGAGVGGAMAASGANLDYGSFVTRMSGYIGVITVVEALLKTLVNRWP